MQRCQKYPNSMPKVEGVNCCGLQKKLSLIWVFRLRILLENPLTKPFQDKLPRNQERPVQVLYK